MNRVFFTVCIMILAVSVSAQPLFYVGSINNKIKIKMSLSKNEKDSVYKGEYFYVAVGKKIRLEGKMNLNPRCKDSIVIHEYLKAEENFNATFKGIFSSDGSFSGKWYSNDGKSFPFKLVLENNIKITYVYNKDYVYPQISGLLNKKLLDSLNKNLVQCKRGEFSDKDEGDDVLTYLHKYNFEIIYNGNNTLTIWTDYELSSLEIIDEDSDLINSHIMGETTRYYSYNLKTGVLLKYSDVLTNNSIGFIKEKIRLGFKEYCDNTIDEELMKEILNSICLTQDGVMFQLPDCGAEGRFDYAEAFVIQYPSLKPYINPNGIINYK